MKGGRSGDKERSGCGPSVPDFDYTVAWRVYFRLENGWVAESCI